MSDATTQDIRVQVIAEYLAEQSEPDKQRFVFAYHIKISNNGDQAVQLIVHMDRTSDVIIKQTSDSIYTAIANAVDRASYNIAKTLQRRLAMRVSRS